ncbi:hypothetical protein JCM5353_000788 [Sporobolomyces roseus]
MPIPSLPIELVGEIVSHLRASPQGDTKEAIESGQALSMVCRRWTPIGQALRWRDLRIDIAFVPSLLAHFDVHPHLPRFVTSFKQLDSSDGRSGSSDLVSPNALGEEGFDALSKLLESLQELRALDLHPVQPTFERVFQAAATLPHLLSAQLVTTKALTWSSKIDSIFVQGFPSLRQFGLNAAEITVEAVVDHRPAKRPLKRFEDLRLSWTSSNSSNLVETILSTVDPATLRSCSIVNRSEHTFLAYWISKCSSLQALLVAGNQLFLTSTFPTLLSNLPEAGSLIFLSISVLEVEESHPSPIPLVTLFASAPSSLRILQARQIRFSHTSFQDHPISSFDKSGHYCVIQGLTSTSDGDRCVVFWRERGSKEKKGYQCILEYSSWDESEARTSESA